MMRNGSNHFFSDGMLLGKRHRRQLKESVTLLRSFFDTPPRRRRRRHPPAERGRVGGAAPLVAALSLDDRGFSVALEHGDHDGANATAQHAHNGSAPAPPLPPTPPAATGAAVEGADSECRWHISVANTGAERNQLDIGVADNVWTVLAPSARPSWPAAVALRRRRAAADLAPEVDGFVPPLAVLATRRRHVRRRRALVLARARPPAPARRHRRARVDRVAFKFNPTQISQVSSLTRDAPTPRRARPPPE